MSQLQQEVPQVPTREQLEQQLTQLVLQRSQLKDQIEQIEKQMPSLNALVQLLAAQEAVAEAAAAEEVTED
jgi:phage shock protein A